ncbi:hypothetical protein [Shinella zoogloeoides]|uniref:hypothetical protein n=1 Tax=Shinella zoogloeoides TaxID=352475 RepID=UPI00273E8698|nr:hypothetical protein [Shinella zoogloeoides]WLR90947.1 hypothetical protein Q9316_00795 [Shinella zoogloeoides]
MTSVFLMRVYKVGDYANPVYYEAINTTELIAEQRLSELWNDHTPADGSRYRATMRRAGDRRIIQSIEWQ